MLNIALFGPPGAGKGTQSKLLLEKYNLTYISTGEILREEIAQQSKLGMQAKAYIDKGELAPDEIIVQIIEEKINMNPETDGLLFDGFPRNIVQAYILEGLLQKMNTSLNCMLSLEVEKDELIKRLEKRATIENRLDDKNREVIDSRLREYDQKQRLLQNFTKSRVSIIPLMVMAPLKKYST
jgi:adenylate kinase